MSPAAGATRIRYRARTAGSQMLSSVVPWLLGASPISSFTFAARPRS
jgi:hypothetical protein